MTEPQRRQHPRYAIELDAVIISDDGEVPGRTQDLSKGGFCILAPKAVPIGIACQARLALVFSENQFSEHLTLPSTVVWCTPVSGAYQIGVKFLPLQPQARGYLEMFMNFLGDSDEEDNQP